MQLKRAIERMDDKTIIFIGSKTNFFFIGTKSEWYRDQEAIENWCSRFTKNEAVLARESWEKTIYSGLPVRSNFANYDSWAKAAFDAVTNLGNTQRRLINSKRALKDYRPVQDRQIVEEYDRIVPDEDPGRIFIINGSEVGLYWTREEYKTKKIEESVASA